MSQPFLNEGHSPLEAEVLVISSHKKSSHDQLNAEHLEVLQLQKYRAVNTPVALGQSSVEASNKFLLPVPTNREFSVALQ